MIDNWKVFSSKVMQLEMCSQKTYPYHKLFLEESISSWLSLNLVFTNLCIVYFLNTSMILIVHFSWNFLVMQTSCLLTCGESIVEEAPAGFAWKALVTNISPCVFMVMAEHWTIDHLPSIQSNLFVKMARTTRQVPLQMLNHRAGLTTHPSIDFLFF